MTADILTLYAGSIDNTIGTTEKEYNTVQFTQKLYDRGANHGHHTDDISG